MAPGRCQYAFHLYRVRKVRESGRRFMVNERVRGETLSCAWPTMSTADKTRVARQTAEYLGQLRELQSSRTESLGDPVYSAYLFCNDFGISHRPFFTDEELWEEMIKSLKHVHFWLSSRCETDEVGVVGALLSTANNFYILSSRHFYVDDKIL